MELQWLQYTFSFIPNFLISWPWDPFSLAQLRCFLFFFPHTPLSQGLSLHARRARERERARQSQKRPWNERRKKTAQRERHFLVHFLLLISNMSVQRREVLLQQRRQKLLAQQQQQQQQKISGLLKTLKTNVEASVEKAVKVGEKKEFSQLSLSFFVLPSRLSLTSISSFARISYSIEALSLLPSLPSSQYWGNSRSGP